VEVAVEDLLNRNMLEKHLTNQKHNLVFQGSNEEINETSDSKKVIEDDSDVKAAAENFDELNREALIEQEVNQTPKGENLETALSELDENYEEEKTDLNEMSVEDSQNELVNYIGSPEETDIPDTEKYETEKFFSEEKSGELVEEQNFVERDYREGTLSWDFGN
jgi:ATP-dependent exoDNAse (exonuclease V) beta subunit